MCGIAGFTTSRPKGADAPEQIAEFLRHRGPDQQGVMRRSGATICAARLKIIDLAGGDQPIVSEDGDTVVAFNGEIYNHREVRAELEAYGYRFQTQCDTETVLNAFLRWDTACFSRLRGMFAAALWSDSRQRLVLARDRMGIKPLYYTQRGNDIYFGSELKTILVHPEIPRRIDATALDMFLSVNYVPGSRTLVEGIFKLPPGHLLEWRGGRVRIERWWTLPQGPKRHLSPEDAKAELDWLLNEAVREHMVSDVPLGVWASGGLDSSTILHYARRHCSGKLKTFSVSFQGRTFDESPYFREVARAYGTDHHEFDLNPEQQLQDAIAQFSYYADEPSADAGALPVWFLSRMCRRHVTVALSGDGADELFGGYVTYLADGLARPLRTVPAPLRRMALGALNRFVPVSNDKISFEYKLKRWIEGSLLHPDRAHFFWNGTFSPEHLRRIRPESGGDELCRLVEGLCIGESSTMNRYMFVDQNFYLTDDILYKTDRMSMAHSLEVRPPFLDHRIVEFAATLPVALKIRGFNQKFVLRELMRGKLPKCVLTRAKTGFDIPTHDWFRGPLRTLLLDTLTAEAVQATGIFDFREIQALIRDHMSRRINAGYHLWGLLTLFLWIKRWRVETAQEARAAVSLPSSRAAISF